MKCEKCGKSINQGQEYDHYDKLLCEDCYMDALSPARTCDPWAVHSAKSLAKAGDGLSHQVTRIQEEILCILKETGGLEPQSLLRRLKLSESEFQREFAALRHMEMVRAEMRDGKKVFRLW